MKTKLFVLISLFLIVELNNIFSKEVLIKVDSSKTIEGNITPLLFGNFIDYLNQFINGSEGLWSQELYDRGFDYPNLVYKNTMFFWKKTGKQFAGDSSLVLKGGYNENGETYIKIINHSVDSKQGICQNVDVYDTVGGEFYVYLKSENLKGKVFLSLQDTLKDKIYFKKEITGIEKSWKKFTVITEPINHIHIVKLVISLEDEGNLDIDESSFMPLHNVGGIRKEYFDLFKEWQPGILRYPGGFFADIKHNNWKASLSNIDKRISPNSIGGHQLQRMDLGLNEYIVFCKSINAEPHLVVNMGSGTVQEAVELMEYCNGTIDSKYGKLRTEAGYPEPFNVKFWEIGNEQWENTPTMAANFLNYYNTLKAIDSSVQIMVSGNTWGGKKYFDEVFDVVNSNCDLYSYHDITPANPVHDNFDEKQRFYSIMAASHVQDNTFNMFRGWLGDRNLTGKIKLALTEYLITYDVTAPAWIDTSYKNATFEAGLWMTSVMQSFIRNSELISVFEKTFGLGHIRIGYNSEGKRVFYPSPIHTIISFLRHHTGNKLIKTTVECDKYSTEYVEGLYQSFNVPFVDATITLNDKKVFIAIINKYIDDSVDVKLDLPFNADNIESKYYELFNDDYNIFNSPDFPDKVKISEKSESFHPFIKVPPHSFTLIEIPVKLDPNNLDSVIINDKFVVYPNPANAYLNIILPDDTVDFKEIVIYDFEGKTVLKFKEITTSPDLRLNIKTLPSGSYFIKLFSGSKTYSNNFKIVR